MGELATNASDVAIIARRASGQGRVFIIQGFSSGPVLLQVSGGALRVERSAGGEESGREGDCNEAERAHVRR